MNFNDLRVKLTNNQNYKSLSEDLQKQLNALVNSYESLHNKIVTEFGENIKRARETEMKRLEKRAKWGTFISYTPWGLGYNLFKGLVNTGADLVSSLLVMGGQTYNNIRKIIEPEGRFGNDLKAWAEELGRDFAYTILDPIYSTAEGLERGVLSIGNVLGVIDDKEFNRKLKSVDTSYDSFRYRTLYGNKNKDLYPSWGINDVYWGVPRKEGSKNSKNAVSEHDYDWSEYWARTVATNANWFKNNVVEPILKATPIFLGAGIAMDELGTTKWGDFSTGVAESMGRMIPAVAASYFNVPPAVTQVYFYSTTFGGAFSDAIEKGADVRSAYDYAYSVAAVETLTEQIGGVKLGELLPSNILKAAIEESSEELLSELMSAGIEHIISGEEATNEDILERGIFAVLGGAISGGVFAGGGQYVQNRTVQGSSINLHNEIVSIYQENNGDYAKTEKSLRKTLNRVLRSYNSENRILNNYFDKNGITPEQRLEAKKQFLNEQTIAKHLIEYNEKTGEFQLTKKGIEMTTDLESYMGDSNKNAYSSTLYGSEDTIATKITNKELTSEQQDVMKLSKKLGSDVVFFTDSDTSINGFFKDGIVYLNTESKKSSLINFIHELTHSLEGTKEYDTLKNFIMKISETNEILKAKMEELGLTKESIIKEYWDQISKLNNIESRVYLMASEYVAFAMSEVILKDKASIESLTKNKTIGRKILNWIKEKIADIKTPKTDIEKAFLKDLKHAKDLYEEALGLGYRKGLKIGEVDKRFSFIGEMGIENYITNEYIKDSGLDSVAEGLKDAKKMFDDGFNNQEILEKTGWYFSKDGNWKFEISDKEVSVKKEFEIKLNEIIENEGVYAFHLSEILNNDKLYKLYPSLRNLDVYLTFEKDETFSGYFSSGIRKRISLNIDALNKNNKGTEIKKVLESYKKDLKTLEEMKKVFDTNKIKTRDLYEKLETGNNIQFGRMILEKYDGDYKGSYKDGLLVSFTRDINGIDFLIKNTEINIKNNEELLKTVKKVDGEHFILPTLLHEIQHYIQTVELWSDGGNLKDGFIYMIQDFLRKNKMVDSFNEMSENDRVDFLFETFKNYPTIAQRFYNYLMFLGELEARTVEKNRTLSQEEINNAKDISHEDNAVVKNSLIAYLNPLDNFYYSLAMKEMLLGFNEFERPNTTELENNKNIYDDELKKSLDKAIDFYNGDIRYSIKIGDNEIAVDTESINDDLVALHNIGENNLIKTIELGGFPMPSIAVTKPNMDHEGYGEITVVFGEDTIDPKKTTKNKVWSGDKWTSTFPQVEYEIDVEVIRKLGKETGLEVFDHQGYRVERMLKNYGLEGTVESIASNPDTKEYFEKNPPKAGLTVKEYLTEVIGNAILNTGIRNNVDIFTNAGNRRSFSQTHYTVSLENILKSMINSETKKGAFYGGTGSMAASNMKNYRSINEIKRDIWKIVDENTTNAQKIELENQLLDVVSDILDNKKHVDRNRFIAFDNAEAILRELGGDGVNKTNIEKWYKEYQIKGSEELTNKIIQMFENLRNKYIRYFESKPERIVNLSEIKNVLLPENTQQKLINLLNENNIPYEVYGEEGRKTHIENMKDIRFSKTIDSEGRKLTVEQEKYFKDSKVRDEQGNLLVMYHGSSSGDFNIFDANKIGENFPSYSVGGFYFTNKKRTAEYYGRNGHIKEVYLNLENPYILKAHEDWYNGSDWFDINPQQHYDQAIQNGNDGIIVEQKYGNMVLAFESNQIKNINNLNPTSSEDIRFSINMDGVDNFRERFNIEKMNKQEVEEFKTKTKEILDKKPRYKDFYEFVKVENLIKINEFDRLKLDGDKKGFNEYVLALVDSIRDGINQPLELSFNPSSKYFTLDNGNHRLLSALLLGIDELPVYARKVLSLNEDTDYRIKEGAYAKEINVDDNHVFKPSVVLGNNLDLSNIESYVNNVHGENINLDNLLDYNNDIRYSRNVDNGIDNKKEIKRLDNLTKRVYDNYEKSDYEKATTKRTRYINDIDFNELGKKSNGKKIVELIKDLQRDYEVIIKKNHSRSEIYNHMFNNVLQEIIIQLESNYETLGFLDYNKMIDAIESAIISTMPYVDDTYTMNEKTETNPKGLQYTKLIHHGFRDLYNAKTQSEYNRILKNKNFDPIWNLIDGLIKLNVADKASVDFFKAGLGNFKKATHVEQRNSMSLRSGGTHVETIPVVVEQNNRHIDNVLALVGKALLDSKDGKKGKYSRDGLLGDLHLLDKFSPARLDMYAVGNIYGLHMDNSTGKIMVKRIEQAQRQQLEVQNAFYDYFEKDGYLKQNENNISALEKQVSTINNLVDSDNKPVVMPNSQVIRLRDTLKREIIRTRLIENKHRGGEISNHFKDNGIIYIDDNTSDRLKNIGNRREVKIVNLIALFNEVDTIVREHDFMENYSKKTRGFYALLYEYENARFKDIRGLEQTNDQFLIDSLSQKEIDVLVDGLNDGVDLTNLYVPTRTIGSNKASGAGAFNINNVIDLGIDDGLVMGITESLDAPAIDSVNLNVPGYMRSVANYYGLYRIVNDLNILFEKGIELPDGSRTTLANKTNQISPYIIPYFEKLLRDMSGYRVQSDSTKEWFNKGKGIVKRNFFKSSLGGNIKVIATQFASAFTLATIHGDYSGTRADFTMRMFSNMVKRGSKTKAKYLIENSEIYKDRARNSTYEVSEATKNEFLKGKLARITEFLMKGINVTDSMINRAFFITLVEDGYSQEEALRITEEGMNRYQSAGLAITKNELLRTEHEVLRLFMKFLSEPMKMTSNIEDSQKQLAIINSFEKNKTNIFEHFDNIVENETNTLNELKDTREEIQEKLAKEKNAEKIEALEKEKKKIDDDITKQEKVVEAETENASNIKNSIENVISQKAEAKKLLGKRVTAFTVSVTYQALLGMVFGLLIRGGIKDRDKDEAMWKFLSKQFGWQLAGEMIGMFPIVRDIYGLIIDGYDANRIGEFQAFNNLGNAVRKLWRDVANGGDFNYGKHLRSVALYLGQSLGIPTRQIERLFTSPASWFAQSWAYNYKSATGQFIAGSELKNAIRDGNTKLVETIMKDKMNQKGVLLTHATSKEINRLATKGVIVSPSRVPNTFTIEGIEYKNNKDKFAKTYNNASFVIEKIISQGSYKRLDDEYKGKLIKAIFNYYYNLAKQEVSGVEIFKKDRVYTLNQAFSYFNGRIPYYLTLQRKDEAKKRRAN